MAKLTVIKPTGERFEISDLSLSEVKELAGLNGHARPNIPLRVPKPGRGLEIADYQGFFKALTPVAKKLIQVLRENPQGIDAELLAKELGFKSTAQIGGLVGGGVGKTAPKYGVDAENVYRRSVSSENGARKVIYFPGEDIGEIK